MLKTPERVALDRQAIQRATDEFQDQFGREPSDAELADRSGFSMRRLAHVRKYKPGIAESALAGGNPGSDPAGARQPGIDPGLAWIHLVYDDLPPVDQVIMEHVLGLFNRPRLSNNEIAAKLRRSPGFISQRKLAIQKLLDQEDSLSPFGAS